MHRVSKRLALLACAVAVAACGGQSKTNPTGVSPGQKGEFGVFYIVNVSTPIGGKVTSADGQIDCGKIGSTVTTACTAQYNWDSPATLSAVADTAVVNGSSAVFNRWAADCSSSVPTGGCVLNTTSDNKADKTAVAVFTGGAAGGPGAVPVAQRTGRVYGYAKNGAAGVVGVTVTATNVADPLKVFTFKTTLASGAYFLGGTAGMPPGAYTLTAPGFTQAITLPNPTDAACIPTWIAEGSRGALEGPTGCNLRVDVATTATTAAAAVTPVVSAAQYNVGFGTPVNLSCAFNGTPAGAVTTTWTQTTGPTVVTLAGGTPSFTTPTLTQVVAATKAAYADKDGLPCMPVTDFYSQTADETCKSTTACPIGAGKGFGCGVSNFAFEGRPRTLAINRQQATEMTYTFTCKVTDGVTTQTGTLTAQMAGPANANYGSGVDANSTLAGSNAYAPLGAIVLIEDDPARANHSFFVTTSTTGAAVPAINAEAGTPYAWLKLPVAGPAASPTSISYTVFVNNTTTGSSTTSAYVKTVTKSFTTNNVVKAVASSNVTVTLPAHGWNTGDLVLVAPASADRWNIVTGGVKGNFGHGQVAITVTGVDTFTYSDGLTPTTTGPWTFTGNMTLSNLSVGTSFGLRANQWTGLINPAVAEFTASGSCGQCHQPNASGSTVGISVSAPTAPWYAWKASPHNQILKDAMAAGDYSTRCIGCHSLGYNPDPNADMGGWNKVAAGLPTAYKLPDFPFLATGCDTNPPTAPATADSCAQMAQVDMPSSVKMLSNIQCESCHGAAIRTAHTEPMTSNTCAYCHDSGTNGNGKHSLYSQWRQSGHSNLATAVTEGPDRNTTAQNHCARCHYAQGFDKYVPVLLGGTPYTMTTPIQGLTRYNVEAVTCQTCHDPHDLMLRLEAPAGNLLLAAGYSISNAGAGTLCASCHNTRNGPNLRQDGVNLVSGSGPHEAAQADVYFGKNAFFLTGVTLAGNVHSRADWFADTCTECHVKAVPAGFATLVNHWFDANRSCEVCHGSGGVNAEGQPIKGAAVMSVNKFRLESLQGKFVAALNARFVGGTITETVDLPAVARAPQAITMGTLITKAVPTTIHGSMGFNITVNGVAQPYPVMLSGFADSTNATPLAISASAPGGNFAKALWNYLLLEYDKSEGIHNMPFVDAVLTQTAATTISIP